MLTIQTCGTTNCNKYMQILPFFQYLVDSCLTTDFFLISRIRASHRKIHYSIGSGNDLAPSESRGLYLSQCWPRPMSLYGVTRTQWLSPFHLNFLLHSGPVYFHNARAASLCRSCWTGFSMLWPCLVPMLRPDQKSDGRYQIHRRV